MFFHIENLKNHKEKNTFVAKTLGEFSKLSGLQWAEFSENEKKKYYDLTEQDRLRYQNELDQIQANGYFIDSNGVKSTDLKVKKKKTKTQN